MSKKPLTWTFLFVLLLGISPLVYAGIHIPFIGHHHHKHCCKQTPSALAKSDETGTPNAAATPAPSQPEMQQEQPSTAMQETPQQPSTNKPSTSEKTQARKQPKALPKTASNLPLVGLIGLAGIAISLLSRALRRTMEA